MKYLALSLATAVSAQSDVLPFINAFIGTRNGGHVFPGATLPYGMVKAVGDSVSDNQGGFSLDSGQVNGFSHLHDSGTGGGLGLGNFPIFPQSGCPNDDLNSCMWQRDDRFCDRDDSKLAVGPGYFSMALNTSIWVEMTVTNHTALYRMTFPETPKPMGKSPSGDIPFSPVILADIGNLGGNSNGNMTVDTGSGRMTGTGTFGASFGVGNYDAFFCADFKGADIRRTGSWKNDQASTDENSASASNGEASGVFVQFEKPEKDNEIFVRVGMSFISSDQACANAEREISDNWDFAAIEDVAKDAWRKVLSSVSLDATGVNDDLKTVFWSGLYRVFISPQDYTGENPLWESDEPYYDSFYCIWDSFRAAHPLLTIVDPIAQTRMIRTLIDVYRHEGYLPDCRMSFDKGFTQGGSNADVVLADAYLKGLSDGINWQDGFDAVVKDAEVEPSNWDVEGRGGVESWKNLGYIPINDDDNAGNGMKTRSVSRTVEYAYNDFCIASMAKSLGSSDQVDKYIKRSGNWVNLFNPDQTSKVNDQDSGFVGFLQPKQADGSWVYADPAKCSPLDSPDSCYLNPDGGETYEGSPWLYTFYAPHDMDKLITTLGGDDEFVSRLQYFHDTEKFIYMGDEQAFLLNVLFHYAGRPGLSSFYHHKFIPSLFNTGNGGIPGNDDSGAMGAYSTMSMMGFWPIPGQNVYLITAPFFKSISVKSPLTGKTATIKCINFDGDNYKNIYIQSAKLNGAPYNKSWFDHTFWNEGGTLELTLGDKESKWGSSEEDRPPGNWKAISQLL